MDGIRKMPRVIFAPFQKENPYQEILASELKKNDFEVIGINDVWLLGHIFNLRPDILHIHWQHVFFYQRNIVRSVLAFSLYILQLSVIKMLRIRIVWTAHNLLMHEPRFTLLDKLTTTVTLTMSDAVFVHCRWAKDYLTSKYRYLKPKKIVVTQHASYIGIYPNQISRLSARKRLSIRPEQLTFLFFGAVREYKGVIDLLKAYRKAELGGDVGLIIAGKPLSRQLQIRVEEDAAAAMNVKLHLKYIANDEIQVFMNAADVVVLPYARVFSSGAALLAMSFGKSIVAPRIGCIGDTLDSAGAFLYDVDEINGLKHSFRHAVRDKSRLAQMGAYNLRAALPLTWKAMAEQTIAAYRGRLGAKR